MTSHNINLPGMQGAALRARVAIPLALVENAVIDALRGSLKGVVDMCDWYNRRHSLSKAKAGSVHLWVREKTNTSRIWIAFGPDEVEFDDISLLAQPSWLDAVVRVGERAYAVFIAEQPSFEPSLDANDDGFINLALVNGTPYESYDTSPWDDRIVSMRELAAFPRRFPDVWQEIVNGAQRERSFV